jgi:hypothetical protein
VAEITEVASYWGAGHQATLFCERIGTGWLVGMIDSLERTLQGGDLVQEVVLGLRLPLVLLCQKAYVLMEFCWWAGCAAGPEYRLRKGDRAE